MTIPHDRLIWLFRSEHDPLARGALEAAGIPALVPDEAPGTFSPYRGVGGLPIATGSGAGASVLQVIESDRDRNVAELRRLDVRNVKKVKPSE